MTDLWDSFKDGIVLCAIVETLSPGNLDFRSLNPNNSLDNVELAFQTAEQCFSIPSLFDPSYFSTAEQADPLLVSNSLSIKFSRLNFKIGEVLPLLVFR